MVFAKNRLTRISVKLWGFLWLLDGAKHVCILVLMGACTSSELPAAAALPQLAPPPPPLQEKKYYKAVKVNQNNGEYFSNFYPHTVWRIGETNTLSSISFPRPVLCCFGYHACENPALPFLSALGYGYSREQGDALLEVRLHGVVVTDNMKSAALSCTPVRVVPWDEYESLVAGPSYVERVPCDSHEVWKVRLFNGVLHSPDENTPALVYKKKLVWFKHGRIHRDGDEPACIVPYACEWFHDGLRARRSGLPAAISSNGSASWFNDEGMTIKDIVVREGVLGTGLVNSGNVVWQLDSAPRATTTAEEEDIRLRSFWFRDLVSMYWTVY